MNLKGWRGGWGTGGSCGPTALALVTKRTVREAEQAIRRANPELAGKPIGGLAKKYMLRALVALGYTAASPLDCHRAVGRSELGCRTGGRRLHELPRDRTMVLLVANHYLVLHRDRVFDTRHPGGVHVSKHANQRVLEAWEVTK